MKKKEWDNAVKTKQQDWGALASWREHMLAGGISCQLEGTLAGWRRGS